MTSVLRSKIKQEGEQLSRRRSDEEDDEKPSTGRGKGGDEGAKSGGSPVKSSHIIVENIEVGVPNDVAYDQWTQYDKWAEVFKKESAKKDGGKGGKSSSSRDRDGDQDSKLTATSKIGPSRRQWEVETLERTPGRRIVWRAKGGIHAKGVTTFHRLDDRLTRVMVDIEYKPSGFLETVGNFFRMQRRRVRKDLRLFKNYIELRQEPTGKGPGEKRGEGLRQDTDAQIGQGKEEKQ